MDGVLRIFCFIMVIFGIVGCTEKVTDPDNNKNSEDNDTTQLIPLALNNMWTYRDESNGEIETMEVISIDSLIFLFSISFELTYPFWFNDSTTPPSSPI